MSCLGIKHPLSEMVTVFFRTTCIFANKPQRKLSEKKSVFKINVGLSRLTFWMNQINDNHTNKVAKSDGHHMLDSKRQSTNIQKGTGSVHSALPVGSCHIRNNAELYST